MDELERDPWAGDVRPIQAGRFKGALRKRVRCYRLIFRVNPEERLVEVAAVLSRGETTYR